MRFAVLATPSIPEKHKRPLPRVTVVADRYTPFLQQAVAQWLTNAANVAIAAHKEPATGLQGWGLWVTTPAFRQTLVATAGQGSPSVKAVLWAIYLAGSKHANLKVRVQKDDFDDLGTEFGISFDLVTPEALDFIEQAVFALIAGITEQVRESIRNVLFNAFQGNATVQDVAREIRQYITLTPQQATAVSNYRTMLESGNYAGALARELRDRRYDAGIRNAALNGATLSQSQIDAMVQRYEERSLAYRAMTIARSEAIRAANAGQQARWKQMEADGLLDNPKQQWISSDDERSCMACPEIADLNPDGIALNGMFQTAYGPVEGPPLHPSCRCALGLV